MRLHPRSIPLLLALAFLPSCRAPFEQTDGFTPPPPPVSGPLLPLRIGSLGPDYAQSAATDLAGNVYVASYFANTVDFDGGSGATTRTASGPYDIAVTKYSATGAFQWTSTIGGTDADVPFQVKVAPDGGVYVVGYITTGAVCSGRPVLSQGGRDAFLMRVTASGTCDWVIDIGGAGDDQAHDLAIDTNGDVIVAGSFSGTVDFDPGAGLQFLVSRGGTDGFVVRYGADGTYRSVAQMGGLEDDVVNAVAIRPDGDIMVAGTFTGTARFGSVSAPESLVSAGGLDYFLARLAPQLGLEWAVRGGGPGNDVISSGGLSIDASGFTYVAGTFTGVASVGPGSGALILVSHGDADIFIANYDGSGTWGAFARVIGGTGTDGVTSLLRDAAGNFYLGGSFQGSVDFDPGPGVTNVNGRGTGGAADAFVLSLDAAGSLRWVDPLSATISGDNNFATTGGIALSSDGSIWAVGRFFGLVDFDPGPDAVQRQSIGDADQFVVRYDGATGALRQE